MTKQINLKKEKIFWISFFLRFGLAFVFVYAGISAFINPQNWIGFVPTFIGNFITRGFVLMGFSILEIILGIGLLFNYKTYYLSIISMIFLGVIMLPNTLILDIIFRDVAIFLMALTLMVLSKKNK